MEFKQNRGRTKTMESTTQRITRMICKDGSPFDKQDLSHVQNDGFIVNHFAGLSSVGMAGEEEMRPELSSERSGRRVVERRVVDKLFNQRTEQGKRGMDVRRQALDDGFEDTELVLQSDGGGEDAHEDVVLFGRDGSDRQRGKPVGEQMHHQLWGVFVGQRRGGDGIKAAALQCVVLAGVEIARLEAAGHCETPLQDHFGKPGQEHGHLGDHFEAEATLREDDVGNGGVEETRDPLLFWQRHVRKVLEPHHHRATGALSLPRTGCQGKLDALRVLEVDDGKDGAPAAGGAVPHLDHELVAVKDLRHLDLLVPDGCFSFHHALGAGAEVAA